MTAAAELARLALLAVLLIEAAAQTGAAAFALWRVRLPEPGRAGAALALGWTLAGAAGLGCGLAGLFRAPVLLAGLLGTAALAAWTVNRRVILRDLLAGWRRTCPSWAAALLAIAALPALVAALGPVREIDAHIYHLGAPRQWLIAGKARVDLVGVNFHLPLPTEAAYALGLALGDERLAHVVTASLLAAAASLFAARFGAAGWLGLLLALAGTQTSSLLVRAKPDLAAAALLAAGAALPLRGAASSSLAGWLWGAAPAAKLPAAPFVLALVAIAPAARRNALGLLASAAPPLAPWLVKNWLALGNPCFPFLYTVIPTLGWGPLNVNYQEAFFDPWRHPGARGLVTLPWSLAAFLGSESVPLAAAAAGALLFGRGRAALAAVLAAGGAVLYAGHISRFAIAAPLLLGFLAAAETARFPVLPARAWTAALALAAALSAWRSPPSEEVRRDALRPLAAARRAFEGPYGEVADAVARAFPGARVLPVGEPLSFAFRSPLVAPASLYDTPLVWRLAREAAGPRRLAIRVRQLGCRAVVYNFVQAQGSSARAWTGAWTPAALACWHAYVSRWLEIAVPPSRVDHHHGGFYVYRVRRDPLAHPPALVFFLPGAEAAFAAGDEQLRVFRRPGDALERYRALSSLFPDVGVFRSKIAYALYAGGRFEEACRAYRPLLRAGMVDDVMYPAFGHAALVTGRYTEARNALRRALPLHPDLAPVNAARLAEAERHLR